MTSRIALLVLIAASLTGCGDDDDQVFLEVADPPGVGCDAGVVVETPPAIDLGAIFVDDLREGVREVPDGLELAFEAVVEPATEASSTVILQVRSDDQEVTLSAPGTDVPPVRSAMAVLTLQRCELPTRYDVAIEIAEPGCVLVIGADPERASFTQLPVPMGVDGCDAPVGASGGDG